MKKTNKSIFTIERLGIRPAGFEDNHGFNYMARGHKVKEVKDIIWRKEFEIKQEELITIITALLNKNE